MQFGCEKCGEGIYNRNIVKMGKAGLSCDHCGHRRVKFITWPKNWQEQYRRLAASLSSTGAQIV